MAPGPALMVAKLGPKPKKKDRNCKEQGALQIFWPWGGPPLPVRLPGQKTGVDKKHFHPSDPDHSLQTLRK